MNGSYGYNRRRSRDRQCIRERLVGLSARNKERALLRALMRKSIEATKLVSIAREKAESEAARIWNEAARKTYRGPLVRFGSPQGKTA